MRKRLQVRTYLSKDPGVRMEEEGMGVVISTQLRSQLAC